MRGKGHKSPSPNQDEKPRKRSRNPRRTCAGSRPSSLDTAAVGEIDNRAHTLVERRYREGLKVKLELLEEALSQVQQPLPSQEAQGSQECVVDGPKPEGAKRTKSDVLHDATSYIYQAEVDLRHLSDEIQRLNDRVRLLEKLVKCEDCKQKSMIRLQAT
jgi:hypothetical protein